VRTGGTSALANKAVAPLSISRSSRSLRVSPQLGQLPLVLGGLANLVAGPSVALDLFDALPHRGPGQIEGPRDLAEGPVFPLVQPTISALNAEANERPPRVLSPPSPWSDILPVANP
jgi:hypothetical protein